MNSGPAAAKEGALTDLEIEAIEMFINFLKLVGLPKSVGEIYGLLFVAPQPLPMDGIMAKLNISLGAASQGLKVLRGVGAVKVVYSPGDRRDHYVADMELSRFATVFIQEEIMPRLDRAGERMERMEHMLARLPAADRKLAKARLERLRHWLTKGRKMLPWIMKFLVR